MLTIDARCDAGECKHYDIYRMVGSCLNCNTKDILILLTMTHKAGGGFKCPVCGCDDVSATRLATEDEIPETTQGVTNE